MIGQAAPGLSLTRLRLTDFRGYAALDWAPAARIVVVTGPNGAGKTNLLEAISLLVPGRGLRGARMSEMARADGPGGFAVSARFATPEGPLALGTACAPGATSRAFQLDGEVPRTQAEIAARVAAVWLTPQMDSLFRDGAGTRRRFLDRLVYALEPAHAREVAAYDNAMAQRNRLLAEGGADPAWLAGLEDAMARHGVAAAAARAGLAQHLSAMLAAGAVAPFPTAILAVDCTIGTWASWATCSVTCAGGTASRTRSVLRPTAGSGAVCPETLTASPCNTEVCPVACVTRVLSTPRWFE